MSEISMLNPREVYKYFDILCSIPRGSSHEKKISNWFVKFAEERGLFCRQDKNYNVLIKKPGTKGYENSSTVILHGHMDMVCKKEVGVQHDFINDGLDVYIEDGYIRARGTTLGADNGIGIAYFLALLDSDDIPHPPLEVALTVMEEMGKVGGNAFDASLLSGKRMIDLNWHKDDHILAGCGGDVSVKYEIPYEKVNLTKDVKAFELSIFGLLGGHCEFDIVLERANSIQLLARYMRNIENAIDARFSNISGGVQNNVIPAESKVTVLVKPDNEEMLRSIIQLTTNEIKNEYACSDAGIKVLLTETDLPKYVFDKDSSLRMTKLILLIPNGVISMSMKIPGISECSSNMGLMETKEDRVEIVCTITSGVTSKKHEVMRNMQALAELAGNGIIAEQFGTDAPEWEYNPDSFLLKAAREAYLKVVGEPSKIEVMPASLELGLFRGKVGGILDIVSIGTETHGVHTPSEELKVESVGKVWEIFKEVLCRLK